jgi:hypothetical protein
VVPVLRRGPLRYEGVTPGRYSRCHSHSRHRNRAASSGIEEVNPRRYPWWCRYKLTGKCKIQENIFCCATTAQCRLKERQTIFSRRMLAPYHVDVQIMLCMSHAQAETILHLEFASPNTLVVTVYRVSFGQNKNLFFITSVDCVLSD